jgi:hypothetical protein
MHGSEICLSFSQEQIRQKAYLSSISLFACQPTKCRHFLFVQGEWYNQEGLQKQMLFMRCVYESQVSYTYLCTYLPDGNITIILLAACAPICSGCSPNFNELIRGKIFDVSVLLRNLTKVLSSSSKASYMSRPGFESRPSVSQAGTLPKSYLDSLLICLF